MGEFYRNNENTQKYVAAAFAREHGVQLQIIEDFSMIWFYI